MKTARFFRAYATLHDGLNIRHFYLNYLCYNLHDAYKHFLHFMKDNPYYNLRFLTVYEVKDGGYEKPIFMFETFLPYDKWQNCTHFYLTAHNKTIAVK